MKWREGAGEQRQHSNISHRVWNKNACGVRSTQGVTRKEAEPLVQFKTAPERIQAPAGLPDPFKCRQELNGTETDSNNSCEEKKRQESQVKPSFQTRREHPQEQCCCSAS